MFCTYCGNRLGEDAAFCTECGTPRAAATTDIDETAAAVGSPAPESSPPTPAAEAGVDVCVTCGETMAAETVFCTKCGTQRSMAAAAEPSPLGAPDSQPTPCATCGHAMADTEVFCTNCGARRTTDPHATDVPMTEGADDSEHAVGDESAAIACASCGTGIADGDAFCTECGARRPAAVPDPDSAPERVGGHGADGVGDPMSTSAADEHSDREEPTAVFAAPPASDCPTCSAPIGEDDAFCTNCGTARDEAPAADVAPPATEEADADTAIVAAVSPSGTAVSPLCTCGARLESGDEFCMQCGAARGAVAGAATAVVAEPTKPLVGTPVAAEPAKRRRGLLALVAFLGVALIAAGGWFAWQTWFAGDATDAANGGTDDAGGAALDGPGISSTLNYVGADGATAPVTGVQIRVRDDSGDVAATAVSDGAGIVAIPLPEAGDYTAELAVDSLPDGISLTSEASNPVAVSVDGVSFVEVSFPLQLGPTAEAQCADAVAQSAAAVEALATGFEGRSLAELGAMARSGADALPGVAEYSAAIEDVGEGLGDIECPEDAVLTQYRDLVGAMATEDPASGVVLGAAVTAIELDGESPTDVAAAAFAAYPQHGAVPPEGDTADELPRWIVILESLEVGDYTQTGAEGIAEEYADELGITTDVLRSDDYASMNPGYWVVHTGWFEGQGDARSQCDAVRSQVDFCYERYVQTLPSTSAPFGECGPYGRYNVTGVGSGTLRVHLAPSAESNVSGTYQANATGILAAGRPIRVGTSVWVPLVTGRTIGWSEARFVTADTGCSVQPAVITTCAELADATARLTEDIVTAAAAVDGSGLSAASALDFAAFDAAAAPLPEIAAALGCDVQSLNAAVRSQQEARAPTAGFASLVHRVVSSDDFYVAG